MFEVCLHIFFLEIGAFLSLKLATQRFFRGKKYENLDFQAIFFKAKTEECR